MSVQEPDGEQKTEEEIGGVDRDPQETSEWIEAFEQLRIYHGEERARYIVRQLHRNALQNAVELPELVQTPYVNSIPVDEQPEYPGDLVIEKKIRAIIRWNAAVMVHRAYNRHLELGGHIATYASAATLYEVGFNHFFRSRENGQPGDSIYFQGHASPGMYARAFLEGYLTEENLENFRQETGGKGLSSYPHPWLMPKMWEYPTVSMGIGPLNAIYSARFNRYLLNRQIKDTSGSRVWAFLGDGECDEPESLGALSIAAREGLDNLVFVVNCNLQRLDGPVRGNFKIIQELEAVFRGAGWNVIKVVWGADWDPLIESDDSGLLVKRMGETCDGEYQKYVVEPGSYTREHFFGKYPETAKLVEGLSDEQIRNLRRGGHDPEKVYAAYHWATTRANGKPTAILAKTVKGWATGDMSEGKNAAHQIKNFKETQIRKFRDRLNIPIPDDKLDPEHPAYYLPPKNSPEIEYLHERRKALGGYVPRRVVRAPKEEIPVLTTFKENLEGSAARAGKEFSTTTAYNAVLGRLIADVKIGKRIVPIIPDEARTFGLETMFSAVGIYSSVDQRYEPVDAAFKATKQNYREAKDGQVLEEGINEAGSMASFTAAGTAYANHGINMIPFYIYYSMFGYQRVGDLIWAAADSRAKGFLLGATAGRTTLNGEGLQHEDGHSPLLFSVVPSCRVYDPAFAYEVAVIIHDGLKRMYQDQESCFYYLTLYNETYVQPEMPAGVEDGIVKGLYLYKAADAKADKTRRVQLVGSGVLLKDVVRAQQLLGEKFGVSADVWSAPSYVQLRRDGIECDRWNLMHPDQEEKIPYVVSQLGATEGPIVAVSDYMRVVPEMIAKWFPGRYLALGTDGFGRSDSRPALRRHFEVDANHTSWAALVQLARSGKFPKKDLAKAQKELGIDPNKVDPSFA
ncbi:MAG TPA: pyruvate dehydrogenase (acetyl-transferring), homodimeric type [Planctomycetota bacterium]|nr:pyruvate dehydrogenase (acetyl-transferring), homodimeric type [Planctomycetota bacterium]